MDVCRHNLDKSTFNLGITKQVNKVTDIIETVAKVDEETRK